MAGAIEQKLASLGVNLHEAPMPVANYVGFVRTGNLLFVSGQVCFDPLGKLIAKGKLGAGVSIEQGQAAARGCGISWTAGYESWVAGRAGVFSGRPPTSFGRLDRLDVVASLVAVAPVHAASATPPSASAASRAIAPHRTLRTRWIAKINMPPQ